MPTARMTSTVWIQGVSNFLVCGSIVASVGFLLGGLISSFFHRPLSESFYLGLGCIWGLAFILFLLNWILDFNAGGHILLDCGPHPTRVLFLIDSALFLILGLWSGFGGKVFFGFAPGSIFAISFGILSLILASGRLQIREGGIWQYWAFVRWERIESCRLTEDSTLLIRAKRRLPLLRGAVSVPADQREAIVRVLEGRCSVIS